MGRQGGPMMTPPNTCFAFQLMCCIFCLQLLSHPQQAELLLESIEPFIGFQGFSGLFENRQLSVLKLLEVVVLVCFSALAGITATSVLLCYSLHTFSDHPLALNKSCQEFSRCRRGTRCWWRHLIMAETSIVSHLHKAYQ